MSQSMQEPPVGRTVLIGDPLRFQADPWTTLEASQLGGSGVGLWLQLWSTMQGDLQRQSYG